MSAEIVISGVTKNYKGCVAVNNVSMTLQGPVIYGLIGKNGAGKTTLLKMISGLAAPSAGKIECTAPNGIGSLIEAPGVFGHLSARDNIIIKMKLTGRTDHDRADALLKLVGLSNSAQRRAGTFSLGMKQRLGIAMALIDDPDILLLDEPINGLDPEGIVLVRDLLLSLKQENKIIIVSSHMLEELSKVSDRYGILEGGSLIKEFTAKELETGFEDAYSIIVSDKEKALAALSELGIEASVSEQYVLIHSDEEKACFAVYKLYEYGVRVREFKKHGTTLERILLSKGGDLNA